MSAAGGNDASAGGSARTDAAHGDAKTAEGGTTAPVPQFEIGLALAGAVSAGSYTAGVLDFLFEALDAWHARPDCPHRVKLSVLSGTSGGALAAAVALLAARSKFPPVRPDTPAAERALNPLYDAAVNRIDIEALLATGDIERDRRVLSILNGDVVARTAADEIAAAERLVRCARPWLADPLRLRFTLTNLDGIAYAERIRGNAAQGTQAMSNHADALRFAVAGAGTAAGAPPQPAGDWRHETLLDDPWRRPASERARALHGVFDAALASAAFPLALQPRTVRKRRDDYSATPVLVPAADRCAVPPHQGRPLLEPLPLYPAWPGGDDPAQPVEFTAVDGGATDNQPLELARLALVGDDPTKRNPRDALTADKAVILVDPFPASAGAAAGGAEALAIPAVARRMLRAWLQQARFRPQEAAIAGQTPGGCFSRFMISPVATADALPGLPPAVPAQPALASGVLAGFGGYLDRRLREHDYFLGRRNAQRFLAEHFVLDAGNGAVFGGWTDPALRRRYRIERDGRTWLPIVPLADHLDPAVAERNVERLPDWPAGCVDVDALRGPLAARLDAAVGCTLDNSRDLGLLGRWIGWLLWKLALRRLALARIIESVRAQLATYRPGGPLNRSP
jgi:hypothetical protein